MHRVDALARSRIAMRIAAFATSCLVACGGSANDSTSASGVPDGPDASMADGGGPGSGGRSASSGGRGGAGTAGKSGEGGCGGGCVLIDCQPGYVTYTPEGQCCPVCMPDCSLVDCALPGCEPGYVAVTPPDQCCPVCVPTDAGLTPTPESDARAP